MNKPISELRLVGGKLGRSGMSDLASEFISECDGTPKEVMKLCGKLSMVAKMATCDEYWQEQVERGVKRAIFRIEKEEC